MSDTCLWCDKPAYRASLCSMHRYRKAKGLDMALPSRKANGGKKATEQCSVEGCDEPYNYKGMCKVHAARVSRTGHPWLNGRGRKTAFDRLESKVDSSGGPDACWPFTGELSHGYGRFRLGGKGSKTVSAHRAAFMFAHGGVEPPMVDHICHDPAFCRGGDQCPHRRCCNPAHLAAATVQENSAADRQWTKRQLSSCPKGHEYTDANTYWEGKPGERTARRCRRCQAQTARDRRLRSLGGDDE